MARNKRSRLAEPIEDPFQERHRYLLRESAQLMGGEFRFETDSPRLLKIVRQAYSGLPSHRLSNSAPRCVVRLALSAIERRPAISIDGEPPPIRQLSANGILCGVMDGANFIALDPQQRSALLVMSPDMLGFPYHVRYEMLEFAVYVLASRVQRLVPLHAACIGRGGRGILLLGSSGAGKSTVSLHCLIHGLDFLAEDSVLVRPEGLMATGVANFLHIRPDSLRFVDDTHSLSAIRKSRVIQRRSGIKKFEIDLRHQRFRLARDPLRISAVVFVSPRHGSPGSLLRPIAKARLLAQLGSSQRYAASQPGWSTFCREVSRLPAFELRRGSHPLRAVEALEQLLPRAPATPVVRRRS
jgi:hypothetical protein